MFNPPRAVAVVVAPGTCASENAIRASSTMKLVTGPPRPRTVPRIVPAQSTGSGSPLNCVSSTKSTGSASSATSVTSSTRPPTPNVMLPRTRDRMLRMSIFVMMKSVTAGFRRLRISRSITPPPVVGSVG
jgi:hypothetical protein